MTMSARRWVMLLIILLPVALLLTGCEDLLTGRAIADVDQGFTDAFIRCADGAGLHVDDMCIQDNVLKTLVSNNRRVRIESLFFIFSGEEEHSLERQMTMDVGQNRVIEQRFPDAEIDQVTLRPTYRAFDGTLLSCRALEIPYHDIRRCGE